MTPEQEDALVNAYWKFVEEWTGRGKEFHDRYKTTGMEFGLACWKAAYAQGNTDGVAAERERAAKVCDEMNGSPWHTPTARKLAAAIRKEEKP